MEVSHAIGQIPESFAAHQAPHRSKRGGRCRPHPHQRQGRQGQAVKAGDLIEVTFGNRPIKVRVLSDVEPRTKDVAREMYEILSE